jgi:hypothetical protein
MSGRRHTFTLEPVPPFRLDLTTWALRRRPHNIVDRWDGETYRRALPVAGVVADVEVRQVGPAAALGYSCRWPPASPRAAHGPSSAPHWGGCWAARPTALGRWPASCTSGSASSRGS